MTQESNYSADDLFSVRVSELENFSFISYNSEYKNTFTYHQKTFDDATNLYKRNQFK